MTTFLDRIAASEILVSDGATGTNLQTRGLPRGISAEQWMFDNPKEIVGLHKGFVDAGAQIILTNTFGASPIRLESADLKSMVVEVNRLAVELARNAIEDAKVLVGGSIGPAGQLMKPYGPLDIDDVCESYAKQAEALDGAGVDLLVIETQFDIKEATVAIEAVRGMSNLPVVCSFSYDRGTRTMMGVSPTQMATEIEPLGVDMLGVNCGSSLEENLSALRELRQATKLPLWFKPNAGKPERVPGGATQYKLTPQAMAAEVPAWIEAGAQVVGGCCGTTPDHLAAIAEQANT